MRGAAVKERPVANLGSDHKTQDATLLLCDCLSLGQNRGNSPLSLKQRVNKRVMHHNSCTDTENSVNWLNEMHRPADMPETTCAASKT